MGEFEQTRLGNLCDFTQGVQIADKDTIKQPQDGYVRYIYIRDLFTDKFPVYVKDVYPNKLLLSGDIVMVNTGNTSGSVYQAKEGVLCNNAFKIAVKSSKLNKLDKGFLWVYLNSDARERMLKRLFNPAGQPHVGHKNVARLDISLPPLPEQRKIAKILSTWDKAISTTERLIDNSKQQKKALMQQLLTGAHTQRKRLLDDSGKPFEGEWEEVKLADVVEFNNGKGHEKHIVEDGKYLVVNSKYISSDGLVKKTTDSAFCLANVGDVLMVMSDVPNGKAIAKCLYVDTSEKFTVNQRVARFRPKSINSIFLYYTLNRNSYYLQFDDGVKQTNLRKDEVLDCPVFRPSDEEQQKIASVLVNADQEIELLEQQLADLKQEKKALMQQLLTGKRRVKVDDKEVA
ncbi:restriction endonuclease subunit S [Pseudoalteromonas sp. S3260]|uniref:restriction endonuclease subunit S n=1 Tax=unclassified Pseudoalteromonas TaxID=194690 RepID=UPI0004155BFF|nr:MULTISPECIES: restriction endonuclease subunit S [unclassified Pseudoalteromonas]MDN3490997.1 restriction endonuclease subunit S [Pseudoalteromonas sp. APC 3694]TMO99514.1 restriction endonuclease subunit S [Pseudoalteromonas sp. S3260]